MVRPCSLTPIGLCFFTEAFNLSNSLAVNDPSKHLRCVRDTCQSSSVVRTVRATYLKLVHLVIVEHAVLVHVAQLEDALEGLNALGLELLQVRSVVCGSTRARVLPLPRDRRAPLWDRAPLSVRRRTPRRHSSRSWRNIRCTSRLPAPHISHVIATSHATYSVLVHDGLVLALEIVDRAFSEGQIHLVAHQYDRH